jgi:hypothetical protein
MNAYVDASLPWFYLDRVSARPGDRVRLFACGPAGQCTLTITRIGREEVTVASIGEVSIQQHDIPATADRDGCDWPCVAEFAVEDDWGSGYYDVQLTHPDGKSTHDFLCVRPALGAATQRALLVLATNTYDAYNYWGGANAYAHVGKLIDEEMPLDEAAAQAAGTLSRKRPRAQLQLFPPADVPRMVNLRVRDMNGWELPVNSDFLERHTPTPYDGAAGFYNKWEHRFAEWAEQQGIALDYATDHDLAHETDALDGYGCVLLVGHSEYWSGEQRQQLEAYATAGGNLAIFSGNTGYWKVRWEDDGQRMAVHKSRGHVEDPLWANPETRPDATHYMSHPSLGMPEAQVTGLSFLYGGYHRLCMCVARGAAAYTVYNDSHWALEGTDLYYGDQFGGDVPLLGYENDGCLLRFGDDGLPKPAGGVGVPDNLEIIAIAPATLFEHPRNPNPPAIPPEDPGFIAKLAYGEDTEQNRERSLRGHAVLASFKKGRGEVFNSGTTEWAHGLAAQDPFVERITQNVLRRFGVLD